MSLKAFALAMACALIATVFPLSPPVAQSAGLDIAGSASTERPEFMGLNAYFDELHQHAGYSPDGCGLPEEAIIAARSTRHNDFMAITDHHYSFYRPEIGSRQRLPHR